MINYNALDIIVDAQGFPVSQYFSEEHGEFAVETTDGSLVLRSDVNFRLKTLILDRDGFPLPQLWDPEQEEFVPRTKLNSSSGSVELNEEIIDGIVDRVSNEIDIPDVNGTVSMSSGIVPEMLPRENWMDDRAYLQQAIDYSEANNMKLTLKQNHTYYLSGPLYFTGLNLEGNGATLVQNTVDAPIMMSRILLDKDGGIGARIHIRNLTFIGNINNPKNHGLYICTFWSKYENLEFQGVGGSGIFLTTTHEDGTLLAWGTLVENMFRDIIVRDSGGVSLLMGELHGNNKITDGVMENILISTGAEAAISISSGAGWAVRGVHTYASSKVNTVGIKISNAFNTSVSDIYIECYTQHAFVFDALQRNLTLSNVNLTLDFAPNDHAAIYVDRQTITPNGDASMTVSNLNVFNGSEGLQANIFQMVNDVKLDVSNVLITGSGKNTTKFSTDTDSSGRYNYMLNSAVEGKFYDNPEKTFLNYEGLQLKQSSHKMFWGTSTMTVSENFKLPSVNEYGKLLCTLSIHASAWHDGGKVCTYVAQVYLSRKSGDYVIYTTPIVSPDGFLTEPVLTLNAEGGLNVSFVPASDSTVGAMFLDYIVGPNY